MSTTPPMLHLVPFQPPPPPPPTPLMSSHLANAPFTPLPPNVVFNPLNTAAARPLKRRRETKPSPSSSPIAPAFSPPEIASAEESKRKEVQLQDLETREQQLWRELYTVRHALVTSRRSLPTPSSVAIEVSRSVMRMASPRRGESKTQQPQHQQQQQASGKSSKRDILAVDTSPVHCDLWQFQSTSFDPSSGLVTEWKNYPAETQDAMNKFKEQGCPDGQYVTHSRFKLEDLPHQIARITPQNMRSVKIYFYESGEPIQIGTGPYEFCEVSIKKRIVRPVRLKRVTFDFSRPSFWTPEHIEPQSVPLPLGHPEYAEISALFERQLKHFKSAYSLVRLDSIQCDHRWEAYVLKKRQFLRELGPLKLNEQLLWHGTEQPNVAKIARGGFLRQYCRTCRYGQGMYFARDPWYSLHSRYATPNASGYQCLMLCKVLVGEYHVGEPDMKRPRPKLFNDITYHAHESTVDNMSNPSVFVTYQDDQAYPMYVLTVKAQ